MGVTYAAGALLAGERNDRAMWALHHGFLEEEAIPTVPAPVVAQAWRGGPRQASLARLLAPCRVEPMDDESSRRVGALAGKAKHEDVIDVCVVDGAIRRNDAVVTSDPDDLRRVARAGGRPRLRIERI